MKTIYLDNAATTCPHPDVVKAMTEALTSLYGNPSALYDKGIEAEKTVKSVRQRIAASIGALPEEIYFTSGGSEGDNMLIKGITDYKPRKGTRIITTQIEHPAVLDVFRFYETQGVDVVYLSVDHDGYVNLEQLADSIDANTVLVSIMGVNNEIGTVQDLKTIGRIIKEKNPNCRFHTDYVQGYMKLPVDVEACKIDALTLCGHKICGPKGIGAVYLRKGVNIRPLIMGGGQESNLRSGTENVPGIVGLGEAIKVQQAFGSEGLDKIRNVRKVMIEALSDIDEMQINGPEDACPYVLSLSFKGIRGEVLLHSLEGEGIYVSTGSACSSHKKEKQHVLTAIGLDSDSKEGTIRVSFSMMTTEEEVLAAAEAIKRQVAQIRLLMRYKK